MSKNIIEARSLVKKFQEKSVIEGVHLEIKEGESFGILGGINAGKTTLSLLLATVIKPSAGDLYINGVNTKEANPNIKSMLGVVLQDDFFDDEFSVEDNLWLYARYHKIPSKQVKNRIKEVMRFMDFGEYVRYSVSSLNIFQKKCLSLARAILHEPPILILDELLTGLNPVQQTFLVDRIKDLKKKGATVVFTTDSYTEASLLADRVGIIAKGRVRLEGSPANLVSDQIGYEVLEFQCPEKEMEYVISHLGAKYDYRTYGTKIYIYLKPGQDSRNVLDVITTDELSLRKARLSDVVKKVELTELL